MSEFWQSILNDKVVLANILALGLGLIRLIALLSFAPFFGPAINMPVRFSLAIALYFPLHPFLVNIIETQNLLAHFDVLYLFALSVKETILGMLLGLLSGLVFYAALSAGLIVDNQRGASQAIGSEIMSGDEVSPFGEVLFLSMVTLFFASGAVLGFFAILYQSYLMWPVFEFLPSLSSANIAVFFSREVNSFLTTALLVCGPFILVSLLTDVSLGIINRFAPQLNVYILSMPIKSGLCAFLIVFFVLPYFDISLWLLAKSSDTLNYFLSFLSGVI